MNSLFLFLILIATGANAFLLNIIARRLEDQVKLNELAERLNQSTQDLQNAIESQKPKPKGK